MNAKKLLTLSGISLSALILVTALVWTLANRERPKSAQFALLIDYSDSRTINCGAIDGIMQEIMSSPNLITNSNLYFFSTGDDKSSDEPVLLGKYKIPVNIKVLEGQSKAERGIQEFISKIKTRCEQEPIKKRSPILLGLKRVIENLRINGCDDKAGCKVFVQTDGQELSEPTVKQSLTAEAASNSKTQISIPNNGINIKICGFAQVSETTKQKNRHNIQTADKTMAVWKQIFTEPNSVLFPPHCQ
jgi:hypothetical protein